MESAKQVIVDRFGGPDVLKVIDVVIPSPGLGQILVRVEAAGVLYGDIMRRTDKYITPTPLPYAPGTEVAGTVAALGQGVSTLGKGDRVLCRVASHGYSQYTLAEAASAIALPESIEFGDATALLAQGLTAYLLTHDAANLSGKSVFIEAASGGVGMQMVQMARTRGAIFIVGSASSQEKRDLALHNGVDLMVSSVTPGWSQEVLDATDGEGLDIAYESSGAMFTELLKCLGPFGTLVKFGRGVDESLTLDPSNLLGKNQALRGFYLPGYFDKIHLPLINKASLALVGSVLRGELKVRVGHRFALNEAALAHRAIEARLTTGKVVLEPWKVSE
ncbi:zinc-binding dehydrogenase [Caballeronia sp. 15715]|uniref:zinc-binding dehydrogenase n=1 Tax=Caballeronia sp. 15715 TaxID=3391030 RepID=UPI0039E31622